MAIPTPVDIVLLERWDDGTIRMKGSRILLDSVIAPYLRGETPEAITDRYPSLPLEDVYGAITYYLRHREEVSAYLVEQEVLRAEVRAEIMRREPPEEIRARLLARLA
jgi:uncharacterized protein (DUF433 family)